MAFAAVASKRTPLAMAGLLKQLVLAAPSASASSSVAARAPAAAALRPAPASVVVAARRLFSTRGAPFRRDDFDFDSESEEEYGSGDGEEEEYIGDEDAVYGRLRSRTFSLFSSSDPFGEPKSRLLALMEDEEEAAAARCGFWVSKEDADAVKLKVAMPGLGKEHVKVLADQDDLVIEGKGDKDAEYDDDDEAPAKYSYRIEFPEDDFKMDQIKAEMKDGLLKVTVPKIKLEERKDVFQVKVE